MGAGVLVRDDGCVAGRPLRGWFGIQEPQSTGPGSEWYAALVYLGQVVAADELILLSDVLGLSVLVDQLTHGSREGTPSSVLGPFWREAPDLPNPALLAPPDAPGEPLVLGGAVTGEDGEPVVGAKVDVWQCDADGRYDVQLADDRPTTVRPPTSGGSDADAANARLCSSVQPIAVRGTGDDLSPNAGSACASRQ